MAPRPPLVNEMCVVYVCGGYTTRWGGVWCNVWCIVRCSVRYSVVRPTMSEGGGYARERGGMRKDGIMCVCHHVCVHYALMKIINPGV